MGRMRLAGLMSVAGPTREVFYLVSVLPKFDPELKSRPRHSCARWSLLTIIASVECRRHGPATGSDFVLHILFDQVVEKDEGREVCTHFPEGLSCYWRSS